MDGTNLDRVREVWAAVRHRYEAYELVVPGVPSFICQAEKCVAHCCKVFSVAMNERELERLQRFSGLERLDLLECEGGKPIELPLADPFLLARSDGHCALLGEDLLCGQYDGRPDACRLYPHQVLFVDALSGRPVNPRLDAFRAALRGDDADIVPLLLRHLECPGFTGPELTAEEWSELLYTTYRLQYHDEAPLEPATVAG